MNRSWTACDQMEDATPVLQSTLLTLQTHKHLIRHAGVSSVSLGISRHVFADKMKSQSHCKIWAQQSLAAAMSVKEKLYKLPAHRCLWRWDWDMDAHYRLVHIEIELKYERSEPSIQRPALKSGRFFAGLHLWRWERLTGRPQLCFHEALSLQVGQSHWAPCYDHGTGEKRAAVTSLNFLQTDLALANSSLTHTQSVHSGIYELNVILQNHCYL